MTSFLVDYFSFGGSLVEEACIVRGCRERMGNEKEGGKMKKSY
jgi:hypothetical protein